MGQGEEERDEEVGSEGSAGQEAAKGPAQALGLRFRFFSLFPRRSERRRVQARRRIPVESR
jgi:hypothetical protein